MIVPGIGRLLATFAKQRPPAAAPQPADQAPQFAPSPAQAATRDQPLLLLYDAHTLRCWATPRKPGTRMQGASECLDWTVEIDGTVEHLGPSTSVHSTPAEAEARIRHWWDAEKARVARDGG